MSKLPVSLSLPLERFRKAMEEGEYSKAMLSALDFFEVGVQYTSIALILSLPEASLPKVRKAVLRIDTKRPLSFGDWMNDFFTPLVLEASAVMPQAVAPIISAVFKRKQNILLGDKSTPGIVQIRNEYKGHGTILSEQIYKGVVETIEPRMWLLAKALEECGSLWENDLEPLVFKSPEGYEYVFQSLKDESVTFISTDENAITLVTDELNQAINARLKKILPTFDVRCDLNMEEIISYSREESERLLGRIYKEKKYNRELFVDREQMSGLLEEFFRSEKTLFPLMGEAGQGKTSQFCYWTEMLMEQGQCVIFLTCSSFSDISLPSYLKRIFGTAEKKNIRRLMDNLHSEAVESGRDIYVFFDALNECLSYYGSEEFGPSALYRDIVETFLRPEYHRFKVIFSCRSFTWNNQVDHLDNLTSKIVFAPSKNETYTIRGFSDEEFAKAFDIYGNLYRITTTLADLAPTARVRLKDPLVLKIASMTCLGGGIPSDSLELTSVSLFSTLTRQIHSSYAGAQQEEIIMDIASILLESYLSGKMIDGISVVALKKAYSDPSDSLHALSHKILTDKGISIAYAELLNRSDRPVLRESAVIGEENDVRIQFVYERFLEFAMARALLLRGPLGDRDFAALLRKNSTSVVFIGSLRNAFLREYDDALLMRLMTDYSSDFEVSQFVSEVLDVMVRENYPVLPLMRAMLESKSQTLHSQASITLFNGVMLSDYFNEGLYGEDVYPLLFRAMSDPFTEVKNDACMYAYYLSKKHKTLELAPIHGNLCEKLVRAAYDRIRSGSLLRTLISKSRRSEAFSLLETAVRLNMMMITDACMEGRKDDAALLIADDRDIFAYFTWNFRLVKAIMPFFQIIARRQITFQSDYVNNMIEYQTFWFPDVVPSEASLGKWSRESICMAIDFVSHYYRSKQMSREQILSQRKAFADLLPQILDCYTLGDSFSYFVLERILVVMGTSDWENVKAFYEEFFTQKYRENEWFDYSQMSVLYSLYQISLHRGGPSEDMLRLYGEQALDWTRRCRGLFRGRRSDVANPRGLYKRNLMSWYSAVYCAGAGDGAVREGDATPVPKFYQLIGESIEAGDKEMVLHIIENIGEIISDSGLVSTALGLLKHLIVSLGTCDDKDYITNIGAVLSTAKNYAPDRVNAFITGELRDLPYPGIPAYRDEILSYNPSRETLSDLFTHRVGNFVMWSLLNLKELDDFAAKAIYMAPGAKDSVQWYDNVIKLAFQSLFGVKI